jgi:hypothetical protein
MDVDYYTLGQRSVHRCFDRWRQITVAGFECFEVHGNEYLRPVRIRHPLAGCFYPKCAADFDGCVSACGLHEQGIGAELCGEFSQVIDLGEGYRHRAFIN